MAFVGGFLGGGVEMVPAGQGQLCMQWLTPDRENITGASFTITGVSASYNLTVQAGDDGRAECLVPAGTYDVSVNHQGHYSNNLPQRVIVESTQSYLILFNSFQEGVSAVQFDGPTLINSYEIRDSEGNARYSGDYLLTNTQVLLDSGSYTIVIHGDEDVEIPFEVSSVGVKYVDLTPYLCIITIDKTKIPLGTKIKGSVLNLDIVEKFGIIKSTGTYTISFDPPKYGNGDSVCTIPDTSVDASQSTASISPVASGTFIVRSESSKIRFPKGMYRVLTVGGGGGGSFGGNNDYSYGSGGGGGGSGRIADKTILLDGEYNITIGTGGSAGTNSSKAGKSGGASSLGNLVSSSGGDGGGNSDDYMTGLGVGGNGMAGGGGGAGASGSTSSPAIGAKGGSAELGGGGGGGKGQIQHGNGGAKGTYGGNGGAGGGGSAGAGTIATDEFYKGNASSANAGTSTQGGGGGGGYTADGGAGGISAYAGGGGGGGCRGGTGGAGTESSDWASSGKGFGAGGGGRTYRASRNTGQAGGGAGGYGTSEANTAGEGKAGCVVYMWMARE